MKNYNNGSSGTATKGGIGFAGLLQIAFIVLKLTKVIDWSWVWVLAPIWISTALAVLCIVIFIILCKI